MQAAIWFFSDGFVVSSVDTRVREATVDIVDHVLDEGSIEEPHPSLQLTPAAVSGAAGRTVGPFTVTTNAPNATVTAVGGTMYSNRRGTTLLGDGTTATVHSGQRIWVRSSGTSSAELEATSEATVPSGDAYLYIGPGDGQKLILAKTATFENVEAKATAEFLPDGSLTVRKRIAGPAAGSQGEVVVNVTCTDGVRRRPFVIPAGTPAGTRSRTYHHIVAGTTCTVIETSNGSVVGTAVEVRGDGQNATIPAGGTATVRLTDRYRHVEAPAGSILVTKTIAGPVAGRQGPVTIRVACNGTALSPDFVIAATTPAGSVSHSFDRIPADAVCTVTETADGATPTVVPIVSGNAETVTVPAGKVVPVNVMDVYEHAPGSLQVTKTIRGPHAGRQGRIAILVACGSPTHTYAFVIPARASAGAVARRFHGLPGGSRCNVTQTETGATSTVSAAITASHTTVTIPANGRVTVHITGHYTRRAPAPPPPRVTG